MKIQQQLATRLYELLPHKKELEFGCRIEKVFWYDSEQDKKEGKVSWKRTISEYGKEGVVIKDLRSEFLPMWVDDGEQLEFEIQPNDIVSFEIIGQPLRLADLLMAIEKVLNDNHICYVNSVGAVYILDMNKSYQKQFEDTNYGEYNLSKDNILDQSDEFCEFVLELLK
jgi:hypothetical protein